MNNFENYIPPWLAQSQIFAVGIIDLEGRYTYLNDFFQKSLSSEKNLLGVSALETIHPEDREKAYLAEQKCLIPPYKNVGVVLRKNYHLSHSEIFKIVEWEFSALLDEQGSPIGIITIGKDRSQFYESQKDLQDTQSKLRAIIDSTNDNNILLSPDYKVLSFNKAAAESVRFFLKAELQEGQDFRHYVVTGMEKTFQEYFHRALSGEVIKEEIAIPLGLQENIWYLVSFFPVFNSERKKRKIIAVSYNASDIDKAKKNELILIGKNKALEEIAYTQSHEIRRPVANILGLLQIFDTQNLSKENLLIFRNLLETSQELDEIIHKIVAKTQQI
ncbi:MAG: hypothetical protein OHK0045_21840 [Raineya sp.]